MIKIDGIIIYDAEDLVIPIYNLTEYSSNYFEITGSSWFYSKDEAIYFNADIANNHNFKIFKYKLLGNTAAQTDNTAKGILENATIAVPLKYWSNFRRSLEIPLINCKVKLKLRWTRYCVLAGTDNANCNNDDNNIISTIKSKKNIYSCSNYISKWQSKTIKTF